MIKTEAKLFLGIHMHCTMNCFCCEYFDIFFGGCSKYRSGLKNRLAWHLSLDPIRAPKSHRTRIKIHQTFDHRVAIGAFGGRFSPAKWVRLWLWPRFYLYTYRLYGLSGWKFQFEFRLLVVSKLKILAADTIQLTR